MHRFELFVPNGSNALAETAGLYCQTLIYVSVILIFFTSSGLLYKLQKGHQEAKMPKAVLWVAAAVVAVAVAAAIKLLLAFE